MPIIEPLLWGINQDGNVFTLSLEEDKAVKRNSGRKFFKRLSAVQRCVWAIGADQEVYLYVNATELPIRVLATTYENQRWTPVYGWSVLSMLPSDRPAWSSADGTQNLRKETFNLTPEWVWEGNWYLDRSLSADFEGWQYAVDFPRKFTQTQKWKSCVRRRKWVRHRRFAGFDKWIKIPDRSALANRDPFQDVCVGGEAIPGMEPGYLAVWACTFHGKVFNRSAVSRDCPEGVEWIEVPSPEAGTLIQLSVGPTGLLWGVTWEGVAVVRTGITHYQPIGNAWATVAPPADDRLLQVSVGTNVVWAVTVSGQILFRKGIRMSSGNRKNSDAIGSSWIDMVGTFSLVSVAPNDQVFALSCQGDHIYFRKDVDPSEPCGREWKLLKIKPGNVEFHGVDESVSELTLDSPSGSMESPSDAEEALEAVSDDYSSSNSAAAAANRVVIIPFWNWITSGACEVDSKFFESLGTSRRTMLSSVSSGSLVNISRMCFKDTTWRKNILNQLHSRDEKEITAFQVYEQAVSQGSWSKRGHLEMLHDQSYNLWCTCHVKVDTGFIENSQPGLLCYYNLGVEYKELRISFADITCVCVVERMDHLNCFAIHTSERTHNRDPLILRTGSEKDLKDWVSTLSVTAAKCHKSEGVPHANAIWATTLAGDVFYSNPPTSPADDVYPSCRYWQQVGGHMRKVEGGACNVVWGLGYDNRPYAFSHGFGAGILTGYATSEVGIFQQTDSQTCFMYENQRWNPVEGFTNRLLPSDRWAWSDVTGVYERTQDGYPLPSSQWSWVGDWSVDYMSPKATSKDGWQFAIDFPRHYHPIKGWNDYVRRRRWKRKCKLTTTGPWIEVLPSISLADVTVQTDPCQEGVVAVWVVGSDGDVAYRHGVTELCPQDSCLFQGVSWEYVPTELPFVSISIGYKRQVWGVAADGSAFLRAGHGENKLTGTMWFHVNGPHNTILKQIAVGERQVWALDRNGSPWNRVNVTDTFPEGTEWKKEMGCLSQISLGPNDQMWAVNHKAIEKNHSTKMSSTWMPSISEFWNHVCIRTDDRRNAPEQDDIEGASEAVESEDVKDFHLPVNQSLYDVDIYTVYRTDSQESLDKNVLDLDENYFGN